MADETATPDEILEKAIQFGVKALTFHRLMREGGNDTKFAKAFYKAASGKNIDLNEFLTYAPTLAAGLLFMADGLVGDAARTFHEETWLRYSFLSEPEFANSFVHEDDPFFLPPGHTAATPVEMFAIDRAIIRVSELLEPFGEHLAFRGDPMDSGQVRLWAASLPNQMGAVMDRNLKLAVIGLTEFINERPPSDLSKNAMKALAVI